MARILVTGGTGSFATAFIEKYSNEHDITAISRDELKQYEMRQKYPNVNYILCDVRDRERVMEVCKGFDYIFHAAALKQVPSCEFFPLEAVKTNILGTANVLDAAGNAKVVCLSTDKAVYPINAMGISKAMMEKVAVSKGAIITRYGNVLNSRGSVIPTWMEMKLRMETIKVTNGSMTRFLLSLSDSIDLVWYAMKNGNPGDIFVKKAPACSIADLALAIAGEYEEIGIRHGEKMHESLISSEEMMRAVDSGDYYCIKPDSRDMNYNKYFTDGQNNVIPEAYTSANTTQLNVEQIKELLNGLAITN